MMNASVMPIVNNSLVFLLIGNCFTTTATTNKTGEMIKTRKICPIIHSGFGKDKTVFKNIDLQES
jgi:hypothetical protein